MFKYPSYTIFKSTGFKLLEVFQEGFGTYDESVLHTSCCFQIIVHQRVAVFWASACHIRSLQCPAMNDTQCIFYLENLFSFSLNKLL